MKMKKFVIPIENNNIDIKNISDEFLVIDIYAISDGINNNDSFFLRESFEDAFPTFYNKPVLAYYNKETNDCEEHNSKLSIDEEGNIFEDYSYEDGQRPVGLVPESAILSVEHIDGKNWIKMSNVLIWTVYAKQVADLIKQQKRKSVSVEVIFVDFYDVEDISYVKQFTFSGITILGDDFKPGIDNASLSLKDVPETKVFKAYREALNSALDKVNKNDILKKYGEFKINNSEKEENEFKEDEYGTGEVIPVDKSKESVSDDSWGDIDKTSLRNKVLDAKNYKKLVKDVYLDVHSEWEDSPSEDLKYPVMQIKDNKAVYNSGGLLSAQQYGESNDESIAKKAFNIRKKLGLIKPDKEVKMNKFIQKAKEHGFSFIGIKNNKFVFVKDCKMEDSEAVDMADVEKVEIFEIDKEEIEKDFAEDMFSESESKLVFEDDEDDDEDEDKDEEEEKDESSDDEKATMAKKIARLEDEKLKMAKDLEKANETLKEHEKTKMREDFEALMAEEEVSEEMKAEFEKDMEEGKYVNFEELQKDFAFKLFTAVREEKREKFHVSLNESKKQLEKKEKDIIDVINDLQ